MPKLKPVASTIIVKLRKKFGYTQEDVASWIGTSKSNYSRKEKIKDGVTLTADEFLTILNEFKKRGPKKENELSLDGIIKDLIK